MNLHNKEYSEPELKAYIAQLEDLAKKSRDLIYKAKWSDYTDNMNADALYEQLCSTVGRI